MSVPDLAPVRPKLAQLVPLLGSNHDGEALGAARAIGRVLKGVGLDLHALARELAEEPKPVIVYRDRPVQSGEPVTWSDLARWCRDHDGGRMTSPERKFVWDMTGRLVMRGEPTEKQASWLRSIYARLKAPTA